MSDAPCFRELIRRVRSGDQQAAADLIRQYEPEIRRFIRVRLTDPHLGRLLDSADICQSVFVTFFVKVNGGLYDLDEPAQLIKLLVTMARNKLVDYARQPDQRRAEDMGAAFWDALPGKGDSPSRVAVKKELLREVRRRLTPAEADLVELRADGKSWQEVAAACGSTPGAVRKRLARALDRVCQELHIDV
jgi:RNA polymerase sigma-70 factor (ECF subfamily)